MTQKNTFIVICMFIYTVRLKYKSLLYNKDNKNQKVKNQ